MELAMAVLHELPGRIRVYYPYLKMNEEICQRMMKTINEHDGFDNIRIEPRIATVLVHYDKEKYSIREVIDLLSTFQYLSEGTKVLGSYSEKRRSLERASHRALTSGILLTASYGLKALSQSNPMVDTLAIVYTGYTVLSHGDRQGGRLHHPDVITAFISSVALGPQKMTEVALTSWIMNIFELFQEYRDLQIKPRLSTFKLVEKFI
ncbi:MAG TPA: hypothetical protein VK118_02010 [Tetragenococcus sp.]|nr:hypothetical protein [Tetragenococcus sp.]